MSYGLANFNVVSVRRGFLSLLMLGIGYMYLTFFGRLYNYLSGGSPNIMLTHPCNVYPLQPILYSKTGVYRGIHYFPIFALKHRLWVHVRTASNEAVLTSTHNLCLEQK